MQALVRTGITALATSVGAGLVVMGVANADGGDDQTYAKREDNAKEWVLVSDEDDNGDDDNRLRDDTSRSRISAGTQHSRESSGRSGDGTRSGYTKRSRDRDASWGDKSRDFTRDGPGDRTRDFSANLTNDHSRNDSRRR